LVARSGEERRYTLPDRVIRGKKKGLSTGPRSRLRGKNGIPALELRQTQPGSNGVIGEVANSSCLNELCTGTPPSILTHDPRIGNGRLGPPAELAKLLHPGDEEQAGALCGCAGMSRWPAR